MSNRAPIGSSRVSAWIVFAAALIAAAAFAGVEAAAGPALAAWAGPALIAAAGALVAGVLARAGILVLGRRAGDGDVADADG